VTGTGQNRGCDVYGTEKYRAVRWPDAAKGRGVAGNCDARGRCDQSFCD
jgi:hypothetical protein